MREADGSVRPLPALDRIVRSLFCKLDRKPWVTQPRISMPEKSCARRMPVSILIRSTEIRNKQFAVDSTINDLSDTLSIGVWVWVF
jgi:hypothetical protein